MSLTFELIRAAAAQQPHGTRARYIAERCRCLLCRAANSRYGCARNAARRDGDTRDLVPAEAARRHIRALSKKRVGYKSVAAAAGVATSVVAKICTGIRKQIRQDTERRLLAVDESAKADRALVPAARSWKLLQELLDRGFSKQQLASWLGYKTKALQFKRELITVRSAYRIERLFDQVNAGKLRRA